MTFNIGILRRRRRFWVIFFQTSSAFGDLLDLSDHPLLLDIFSQGPPQLRTGLGFLFSFKVSFEKHPSVDGLSCVKCDARFCRKVYLPSFQPVKLVISQCLNVNLGAGFIKLASASEGDWTCLLCKSAPLEKLRSSLLAPLQVGHE